MWQGLVIWRLLLLAGADSGNGKAVGGQLRLPTASFRAALLPTFSRRAILGCPSNPPRFFRDTTQRLRLVCGSACAHVHHIPIYSLFVVPRVASCVRKLDLRKHRVVVIDGIVLKRHRGTPDLRTGEATPCTGKRHRVALLCVPWLHTGGSAVSISMGRLLSHRVVGLG